MVRITTRTSRLSRFSCDQRIDPVEVRHRDVGDDDIRSQASRGFQQLPPILHNRNQLELLLEQALDAFREHAMVVGHQYARAAHHAATASGTHADIVVP